MAENSKIEWTTHTFNPWRGCTKVSAGCDICYAESLSKRNPGTLGIWGKYGTRVIASEAMWRQPLKWNAEAARLGERHRVFCASLADVFEGDDTMPEASQAAVKAARRRLFTLIEATPNLDWLLLTKRPENVERILKERFPTPYGLDLSGANSFIDVWLDRIWLGTSVEDQKTADERIPHLLNTPAAVRFLSVEPLLGPVDIKRFFFLCDCDNDVECECKGVCVQWAIVGGESGTNARPMHPDWVRSIREQCQAAGVPFFFKQWGEWLPLKDADALFGEKAVLKMSSGELFMDGTFFTGDDLAASLEPEVMVHVGKKKAGRLLDGRTWDEFPEVKNG